MYTPTTNAPESANFSKQDQQVFEAARAAAASLAKTFELWATIARAVELAKAKAEKIGTRNAFRRILEQQGLAGVLGSRWESQKSTASKLLKILDRLPEIEEWRSTLTPYQRVNWAAPTTVYKHCPIFMIEQDQNEEEENKELAEMFGGPADADAEDDIHARCQREIAALRARIDELEAENKLLSAQNAALQQRLHARRDEGRLPRPHGAEEV
jgi:hypothetical protein